MDGAAAPARLALANHWAQQLSTEIGRLDSALHSREHDVQTRLAASVVRAERDKGWILVGTLVLLAGAALYAGLLYGRFRTELQRRERLLADLARSRAELAAQALELRKLSWVAERTHNAVVITDAQGRTEWVNEGFERLTGWTLAELRGREAHVLLQGPDTDPATVARVEASLRACEPVDVELLNYAKDGRSYWVRIDIQAVRDADGRVTHFVAVQSDVSAQHSIRRQLEDARDHAVAAASARAQFLANTSHEIRTPLNGVLGMTELLLRTKLDERQRRYGDTVLRSARHLLAIINDVLDFAKMDAGRLELDPAAADLREFVVEFAAGVEAEARAKGLDFALELPAGPLPVVAVDLARLRQVLLNLTSNALKFTKEGGMTLRIAAERTRGALEVRFEVADTVCGIPAEMQAHVFQPFVQAGRHVAIDYGGTGLGLSIARQLARLMGGDVTLRSAAGQGTTFVVRVRLPIAVRAADGAAGPAGAPDAGGSAPLRLRVLVAEDYHVNQEVVRESLAALGCDAVVVDDGQAAVERYRATPGDFDAILMDCRMPRLDGFEATTAIRAWEAEVRRAPVPIVALTAGALAADRQRCTEVGMNGFLAKPLVLAELRDALAAVA